MLNILKKYRIPIIILLVLVLLFTVIFGPYIHRKINVQNVFDEMVFSNRRFKGISFEEEPSFLAVRALKRTRETTMLFYRDEFLNENEKLTVIPGVNSHRITLFFTYSEADFDMIVKYSYDSKTKELTGEPLEFERGAFSSEPGGDYSMYIERMHQLGITVDTIKDLKHYILYDKILTGWFEGNGDRSMFSMDNLGEFTVVNDTFADIGTDW